MKKSKNICLIEDSIIVRDLLAFTIENNIKCTVHCIDLERTIEHIMEICPDVIILDYSLMGNDVEINTMDLLAYFGTALPDVPVIIFSGQTNLSIAADLLKKGAVDYISKNAPTFHDDIIKSLKKSLKFIELSKEKKSLQKKNLNHILKIISLSFIMVSLIGYVLIS